MKLKTVLVSALLLTSFTAAAELKMSVNQQSNGVLVTVTQNGKSVANAKVSSNIRGQQTEVTSDKGQAFFHKGNIARVYKFEAVTPEGNSVKASRFIGRDR